MVRGFVLIFFFSVAVLLSVTGFAGCGGGTSGILHGTVTVGPLSPVEKPGETRPVPAEVFKSRWIIVYDASHSRVIRQADLNQVDATSIATYSVNLPAGTYIIDINHSGIDRSGQVPATIEIKAGETTTLDINIDTGIR